MHHDQDAERRTHSEQDKPIFGLRMIRIIDDARPFVEERRLRFDERHAVFPDVGSSLRLVPRESQTGHSPASMHDVFTMSNWQHGAVSTEATEIRDQARKARAPEGGANLLDE